MYQYTYAESIILLYFLSFYWKHITQLIAEYSGVEVIRVKCSCSLQGNGR